LNGVYFDIEDLAEYAAKVLAHGCSIERRSDATGELIAYVLYYDNKPDMFVSMVWTHPSYRGRGHAKRLLQELVASSRKDIFLDVHADNPAIHLYKRLGFTIMTSYGQMQQMCLKRRIAIMQPYIFPYIGYFHLITSSCLFVFYDDVNYITRGWINRNRILINNADSLFTVPVSKASQNQLINSTCPAIDDAWRRKFCRTITHAYRKAPYFSKAEPVVSEVFLADYNSIADLAINSIINVYNYLNIPFRYTRSSICAPDTMGMDKADRLITITKREGFARYVNAPGGIKLYDKQYFARRNVELSFVKSQSIHYKQFADYFVPALSIIDVLMFNSPQDVVKMFGRYTLE